MSKSVFPMDSTPWRRTAPAALAFFLALTSVQAQTRASSTPAFAPAATPAFQLPLIQNGDFARAQDNWYLGGDDRVKASVVPVGNQPFAHALHLDLSPKANDVLWSVVLTQPFSSSLHAGDVVTARFWARSPQSLRAAVNCEDRKTYSKFLAQEIALTPDWKEFTLTAKADKTYARGDAQLNFHLGQLAGAVEFADVRASRPIFADAATQTATVPGGGVPVVDGADLTLINGAEYGETRAVEVKGQPFTHALRVQTRVGRERGWDFQFGAWSKTPVKKGDTLLASFYARAVQGQAETGEAHMVMQFQSGGPEWDKSISQDVGIGRAWKRYDFPFVAGRDMAAGNGFWAFPAGFNPQTIEVGGAQLLDFGDKVAVESLPRTSTDYPGQEEGAPWRKAALARIERIRKGDLRVVVQDARGKSVKGASVEIRMTRQAFGFGNIAAADFLLTDGADATRYRETLLANYNRITIENHFKWNGWEGWGPTDGLKTLKRLRDHNIEVRGHNLIWPSYRNSPDDLPKIGADKDALRKRINAHFADILGKTRGQTVEWDVVNEPFDNHDLLDILGRDEMVSWFKQARQLEPNARLFLNDYPPLDGAATTNPHLNALYDNVQMLQKAGAPIGGIGFQGHFGSAPIPPERVLSGLDRFAKLGLPIAITEFDMDTPDEDLQARYMRDFLIAVYSHPSANEVIMWGFWQSKHWLPNAALYRADWSIKPNGQVWLDLVKGAWWTNADGRSDAKGTYQTRGFYGDYTVTATDAAGKTATKTFSLAPGQSGPVVVKLG